MRIREICAHGYDNLCNATMRDISPGLVLVEGENGAGKTTFFRFVRSLLEGMKGVHHKPLRGGKHGGELVLDIGEVAYRVTREFGAKDAVRMVRIDTLADADPKSLLPDPEGKVFTDIFTITLDELLTGSDKVQARIDAALAGTGVLGLAAALKSATDAREKLFLPRGTTKPIYLAIANLDQKTNEVKTHENEADTYRELGEQLAAAVEARDRAVQSAASAEARFARARRLAEAWPILGNVLRLEAELAALPPEVELPPKPLEELTRRKEAVAAADEALKKLRDELQDKEASPGTDSAILAESATIAALQGETAVVQQANAVVAAWPRTAPDLEEKVRVARAILGDEIDPEQPWNEEDVRAMLSGYRTQLAEAVGQTKRTSEDLEAARRKQAEAQEAHAKEEAAVRSRWPEVPPETADLEAGLQAWRAQVREAATKRQLAEGLKATVSGGGSRAAWPVAIVLGLILAVVGYIAAPPFGAALVLGGVVGYFLVKLLGRSDVQAVKNLAQAELEADQAEAEAQRLGAPHGWVPTDVHAAEQAVETARRRREAYDKDAGNLRAAVATAESAAKEAESAATRNQAALDEEGKHRAIWREKLTGLKLPDKAPAELDAWFASLGKYRAAVTALNQAKTDADRARATLDTFTQNVLNLATRLGRAPESEIDALDTLAVLFKELADAQKGAGQVEERALRIQELKEKAIPAAETQAQSAQAAYRDLLAKTEAGTEEAFGQLVEIEADRAKRRADKTAKESELKGTCPEGEAPEDWLAEVETTEGRPADPAERDAAVSERQTCIEAVARLEEKRKSLRDDTKLQADLIALAEAEASVAELVDRYVDATVRWALLESARQEFESKHQTPVLNRASEFLAELTGGDCPELKMATEMERGKPVRALRVIDRDGKDRGKDQLNRSLLERALLAVRLGYIEQYAADNEGLPIVLDDVFVNFDPRHTDLAAETFLRLSERHQVLYMTCHPQTHATFRKAAESTGIPFQSWKLENYLFVPHRTE